MTSEVQSVVFKLNNPNKWTKSRAMTWLHNHGLSLLAGKTVDVTKNSLRYRINDPKRYIRFVTKVSSGKFGEIQFVIGTRSLASDRVKKKKRKKKKKK